MPQQVRRVAAQISNPLAVVGAGTSLPAIAATLSKRERKAATAAFRSTTANEPCRFLRSHANFHQQAQIW